MSYQHTGLRAGIVLLALGCAICIVPACRSERATPQLCTEILSRIVEIELRERGFRDPALLVRKRDELQHELAPELAGCAGQRVRRGALACVRHAASTEQLSHDCLR